MNLPSSKKSTNPLPPSDRRKKVPVKKIKVPAPINKETFAESLSPAFKAFLEMLIEDIVKEDLGITEP